MTASKSISLDDRTDESLISLSQRVVADNPGSRLGKLVSQATEKSSAQFRGSAIPEK